MAKQVDLSEKERLQPSLLDRLTDREPGELKESARDRVIDIRKLREIIQRDLGWLLNTSNNDASIDPELYPHAARSTLNFGISDVAGKLAVNSAARMLENAVSKAIYDLEPRLIPGSLDVRSSNSDDGPKSQISIDIRGELWASPVPIELYVRTHLNVADGDVVIDKVM
jgi:type VI secretion system protein ImpF